MGIAGPGAVARDMGRLSLLAIAAALIVTACAPPREPQTQLFQPWVSPLGRDHPLTRRIWDANRQSFVSQDDFMGALAGAPYVGLGEQHDNADQHLIQAKVIDALTARGRAPGVVFEMLDRHQEPLVQRAIEEHPRDPDALSAAVDWAHSGWPAWALYRPVFAAAVSKNLPLFAAGVDREAAMHLAAEGIQAAPPDLVRDYALDVPLPTIEQESMRKEMSEAHCGLLPDSMLDGMVFVQRVRDATLANGLMRAGAQRGGVLIAGNGHVRRDRGVPALLRRRGNATMIAVGLLEVKDGAAEPADYAAPFGVAELPFDFVVFTPRASDRDHCAELRAPGAGQRK